MDDGISLRDKCAIECLLFLSDTLDKGFRILFYVDLGRYFVWCKM